MMCVITTHMAKRNGNGKKRWIKQLPIVSILTGIWILSACSSSNDASPTVDRSNASNSSNFGATASRGADFVPPTPSKSPSQLYREANVKQNLIPKGRHARKYKRRLDPKSITIHSTQNYSAGADAWRHAKALNNGKLRARKRKGGNRIGYLVWHFTVDENVVVQHLPTNEQGEHADFDGPGNNTSLGIEMCEHKGNSRAATIERTAKLTAWLMYKHDIPLRKVVPHYHWERKGLSTPHKNCPHYLLDNGRPGAKWQWFLAKVNKHYKSITSSSPSFASHSTNTARTSSAYEPSTAIPLSSYRAATEAPAPVASRSQFNNRFYTVRRGDTLYSISRRYGISVGELQRANGLRGTAISSGRRLRIP